MTVSGHTANIALPTLTPRYFALHPRLRRIVFVAGYEGLGVLFTTLVLGGMLGHGGASSFTTAVLVSTAATIWNYLWNTIFEAIERRRGAQSRGVVSRSIHAFGYEGGVLVFTVPIVALMLKVSALEALAIEAGLLVFFLIFTVVYTWAFDAIFGLPASVQRGE